MALCMELFDFLKGSPPVPRAPTGPFFDDNDVPNFLSVDGQAEDAKGDPARLCA
jgi:hypothetical protein